MKKMLLTCIAVILILASFSSVYYASEPIMPDELVFSSLDELLAAHKAVRDGTADAELAALAESVNFIELAELFFPTSIPAEYNLHKISVTFDDVRILYLLEGDQVSAIAISNAIIQQKAFEFGYFRKERVNPMEACLRLNNATLKDLINGIYLRTYSTSLFWGTERLRLDLIMPASFSNVKNKDIVKFAAIDAVDIETGERQPYSPPVLYVHCWQKAPAWVQWILRYICFGWIWMK